ncbi:MAG: hypothetical protein JW717_08920 [Marinilabiliaceae bacterium]|nr:hypothetical protein [Marinilabiliaceae bacterium]
MNNGREKIKFVFFYCCLCVFFSCDLFKVETIETVPAKPEIAVPLVELNVSIQNIIDQYNLESVSPDTISSDLNVINYEGFTYIFPKQIDTSYLYSVELQRDGEFWNRIEYIVIRSNFTNYSNADALIQLYFYNRYDIIPFDSLYSSGPIKIEKGKKNIDLTVQKRDFFRIDEFIDYQKINRFLDLSKIGVSVNFQFEQGESSVVYKSDPLLWMQIGCRIGLNIETDL